MSLVHRITRDTIKSSIELNFKDFTMTLDEYSETMYPKGNEGGFVAVATKNNDGFIQEVVPISKWTNKVQLDTNCYVSINTFYRPERRIRSVRHLNAFFVDVDYYNANVSKDDVIQAIEFYIQTERIVEPTFIIDSGQGLYIIWKIEDVPGIYKQTKALYDLIQNYIYKLFKEYGADSSARDIARVLRVPNTYHEKANKYVEVNYFNSEAVYTMSMFQEYVDPFEIYRNDKIKNSKKKPKRKNTIKHLYNAYTLSKARSNDIEKLCYIRNYSLQGMRNNILFVYHYYMLQIHRNEQVAFYHTLNLNDKFVDPLSERDVKSYVQSSVRAYHEHVEDNNKGYNYKNETLIELYNITAVEQKQLKTIISQREKYDRNNKRRKINRRNENGLTIREEEKQKTLEQVKFYYEKGLKQVEIAEKIGLSRSRISQIFKEINVCE